MKNSYLQYLIILFAFLLILSSCKKTTTNIGCFDSRLKENSKNTICTMDCPGITGCDGKFYCNACVAAWEGIRPR